MGNYTCIWFQRAACFWKFAFTFVCRLISSIKLKKSDWCWFCSESMRLKCSDYNFWKDWQFEHFDSTPALKHSYFDRSVFCLEWSFSSSDLRDELSDEVFFFLVWQVDWTNFVGKHKTLRSKFSLGLLRMGVSTCSTPILSPCVNAYNSDVATLKHCEHVLTI